jgi:hypothetical protein
VLDGLELNAADFQIAPNLPLLLASADGARLSSGTLPSRWPAA